MNTFRIGYKSFYRETSDHNSDYIRAENEDAALKIFAKEHKIPRASRQLPEKNGIGGKVNGFASSGLLNR